MNRLPELEFIPRDYWLLHIYAFLFADDTTLVLPCVSWDVVWKEMRKLLIRASVEENQDKREVFTLKGDMNFNTVVTGIGVSAEAQFSHLTKKFNKTLPRVKHLTLFLAPGNSLYAVFRSIARSSLGHGAQLHGYSWRLYEQLQIKEEGFLKRLRPCFAGMSYLELCHTFNMLPLVAFATELFIKHTMHSTRMPRHRANRVLGEGVLILIDPCRRNSGVPKSTICAKSKIPPCNPSFVPNLTRTATARADNEFSLEDWNENDNTLLKVRAEAVVNTRTNAGTWHYDESSRSGSNTHINSKKQVAFEEAILIPRDEAKIAMGYSRMVASSSLLEDSVADIRKQARKVEEAAYPVTPLFKKLARKWSCTSKEAVIRTKRIMSKDRDGTMTNMSQPWERPPLARAAEVLSLANATPIDRATVVEIANDKSRAEMLKWESLIILCRMMDKDRKSHDLIKPMVDNVAKKSIKNGGHCNLEIHSAKKRMKQCRALWQRKTTMKGRVCNHDFYATWGMDVDDVNESAAENESSFCVDVHTEMKAQGGIMHENKCRWCGVKVNENDLSHMNTHREHILELNSGLIHTQAEKGKPDLDRELQITKMTNSTILDLIHLKPEDLTSIDVESVDVNGGVIDPQVNSLIKDSMKPKLSMLQLMSSKLTTAQGKEAGARRARGKMSAKSVAALKRSGEKISDAISCDRQGIFETVSIPLILYSDSGLWTEYSMRANYPENYRNKSKFLKAMAAAPNFNLHMFIEEDRKLLIDHEQLHICPRYSCFHINLKKNVHASKGQMCSSLVFGKDLAAPAKERKTTVTKKDNKNTIFGRPLQTGLARMGPEPKKRGTIQVSFQTQLQGHASHNTAILSRLESGVEEVDVDQIIADLTVQRRAMVSNVKSIKIKTLDNLQEKAEEFGLVIKTCYKKTTSQGQARRPYASDRKIMKRKQLLPTVALASSSFLQLSETISYEFPRGILSYPECSYLRSSAGRRNVANQCGFFAIDFAYGKRASEEAVAMSECASTPYHKASDYVQELKFCEIGRIMCGRILAERGVTDEMTARQNVFSSSSPSASIKSPYPISRYSSFLLCPPGKFSFHPVCLLHFLCSDHKMGPINRFNSALRSCVASAKEVRKQYKKDRAAGKRTNYDPTNNKILKLFKTYSGEEHQWKESNSGGHKHTSVLTDDGPVKFHAYNNKTVMVSGTTGTCFKELNKLIREEIARGKPEHDMAWSELDTAESSRPKKIADLDEVSSDRISQPPPLPKGPPPPLSKAGQKKATLAGTGTSLNPGGSAKHAVEPKVPPPKYEDLMTPGGNAKLIESVICSTIKEDLRQNLSSMDRDESMDKSSNVSLVQETPQVGEKLKTSTKATMRKELKESIVEGLQPHSQIGSASAKGGGAKVRKNSKDAKAKSGASKAKSASRSSVPRGKPPQKAGPVAVDEKPGGKDGPPRKDPPAVSTTKGNNSEEGSMIIGQKSPSPVAMVDKVQNQTDKSQYGKDKDQCNKDKSQSEKLALRNKLLMELKELENELKPGTGSFKQQGESQCAVSDTPPTTDISHVQSSQEVIVVSTGNSDSSSNSHPESQVEPESYIPVHDAQEPAIFQDEAVRTEIVASERVIQDMASFPAGKTEQELDSQDGVSATGKFSPVKGRPELEQDYTQRVAMGNADGTIDSPVIATADSDDDTDDSEEEEDEDSSDFTEGDLLELQKQVSKSQMEERRALWSSGFAATTGNKKDTGESEDRRMALNAATAHFDAISKRESVDLLSMEVCSHNKEGRQNAQEEVGAKPRRTIPKEAMVHLNPLLFRENSSSFEEWLLCEPTEAEQEESAQKDFKSLNILREGRYLSTLLDLHGKYDPKDALVLLRCMSAGDKAFLWKAMRELYRSLTIPVASHDSDPAFGKRV